MNTNGKKRVIIETGSEPNQRILAEYTPQGWALIGDTYTWRHTIGGQPNATYLHGDRMWVVGSTELPTAIQALGKVVDVSGNGNNSGVDDKTEHLRKIVQDIVDDKFDGGSQSLQQATIDIIDSVIKDLRDNGDPPPADNPPPPEIITKFKNLTYKRKHATPKARIWKRIKPANADLPRWFIPPSWFTHLRTYLLCRSAIALVGPAGNGKTSAAEVAFKAEGIGYSVINCTDRTEVVDLIGGLLLTSEGEQWRDGVVTKAFREKKGVILDEADALDPRVMMALQTATLDPGPENTSRYIIANGEKVFPSGKCPIVMTMNTVGSGATRQYVGRNQLDAASLDRITMIQTKYENELEILASRGVSKANAKKIVDWAQERRQRIDDTGLKLVVSPRTMMRIAECVERFGWDFDTACELEFYSRLDEHERELLEPKRSFRKFGESRFGR